MMWIVECVAEDEHLQFLQVKDARSGPGLKSMSRIKSRQVGGDVTADYLPSPAYDVTMAKYCSSSPGGAKLNSLGSRSAGPLYRIGNSSSMFIDSDYWTPWVLSSSLFTTLSLSLCLDILLCLWNFTFCIFCMTVFCHFHTFRQQHLNVK